MRILLSFLFYFYAIASTAQGAEAIRLSSEISSVRLFQQGAQVTRIAQKQIPAGSHTLLFTGLTQNMDPNSIQLSGSGGITILSISHKKDFVTPEDKNGPMRTIESEIEKVDEKLRAQRAREDALLKEKDMILANQKIGGQNTGFNLQELRQTAEFFRNRIEAVNIEVEEIRQQIKDLEEERRNLQNQLNQEKRAFAKKTGQVEVKIEASAATTANLELMYLVNNAGWQSVYDARVDDLESPVKLTQKAQIVQQTGEDWNGVKLTLNTGNPQRGGQVPYLNTWYVDFIQRPYVDGVKVRGARSQPEMRNADEMAKSQVLAEEDISYQSFEVQQTLTQEEYSIDKRQNIPSSGNPGVVQLRVLELPAEYEYHIKPRLDKDAFLIARLYDWDQYNLMDGQLSLFNGNTYVGEAYLNTMSPDDTLELSLGRDQNIIVQRNRVHSKQEKTLLGGKRIEEFTWKIEVRNAKNTAAKILLKEPVPVSRNSEIEVKVGELSGGQRDAETGIVKWEFDLPPGQEKEFRVSYELKYPKGKQVSY